MDRRKGSRPGTRPEPEGGKSEVAAWVRLLDEIREPDCAQAIVNRVEELLWVLDHQDDIDADFLAIYGIDLEQVEISGPRYFALAHRLTAYHGVMAARAESERDQTQSHNTSTTTRTHSSPPPTTGGGENREVSLTAFRFMFPGMVSGGG